MNSIFINYFVVFRKNAYLCKLNKAKKMDRTIFSHIRQSDLAVQPNQERQQGVAQRAKEYATEFGMGDLGQTHPTK